MTQTLEKLHVHPILDKSRLEWLDNSHIAIEEYTQFIEKNGCFGDLLRCF